MVKYRCRHSEKGVLDDEDDRRTIMPCDSISQVSSNPARKSSVSRNGSGSYASSSWSKMSTIQGERVWNPELGCWTEVREPRMSARRQLVF